MNLCNINHSFNYELEKLCRIFLPYEKISVINEIIEDEIYAVCKTEDRTCFSYLNFFGKEFKETLISPDDTDKEKELTLATTLFQCFVKATGYKSEWGLLTGVRPAKLFSRLVKNFGVEKAEEYFKGRLLVSDEKTSLCKTTSLSEEIIIENNSRNSFSLYVSIPFCPSRCSYCSFVSHSVDKAGKLIDEYVELLCEEIKETGKVASKENLKLETVYIGGGTPVAISAIQITKIMDSIRANFDLTNVSEYTVEAGRPDAIDKDKLIAIKNGGATRISVNPQTMNDKVLKEIGRNHTSQQTIEAFKLARDVGFNSINMDLIAGLPTDTLDSFKQTLNTLLELDPESITVHSLSVKRASNISRENMLPQFETGKVASQMVQYARNTLSGKGIVPYYMYRQSKTVGNLENVGYAKNGFEGLYNVYIMDETHTILACGASAVTKLREPGGDYIERIYNFKYPYEYISRFGELIERKKGIVEFYKKYPVETEQ
ncbi:MAG: coproporphyrinogen dehydrogenase HemZ [Clostridia bacterium]|nr:coproporphyrinogen dehydrogenase HemZ [Clostridia bacterium]